MSRKTLASSNPYLKKPGAARHIITNVASSTAIETGKPSSDYVSRYAVKSKSKPLKK